MELVATQKTAKALIQVKPHGRAHLQERSGKGSSIETPLVVSA